MTNALPFVPQASKRKRRNNHQGIVEAGNKLAALAIGCEDGFPSVPRNDPSVGSAASCLNPSREEKAQCEGKCIKVNSIVGA